jgi:hypothetical protein
MDQEWCGFTRASSGVRLTEYVLRVIKQVLPIRHGLRVLRQSNRRAMKSVIVLAVLKLLANPLTDHDLSHIRVDTQVSPVKERVKIASQAAQLGFQVIPAEKGVMFLGSRFAGSEHLRCAARSAHSAAQWLSQPASGPAAMQWSGRAGWAG